MFNSCSIKETPVGREYSELSVFQLEKVTAARRPQDFWPRPWHEIPDRKVPIYDGRGPRLDGRERPWEVRPYIHVIHTGHHTGHHNVVHWHDWHNDGSGKWGWH